MGIVIHGARLIDGTGRGPIDHAAIHIEGKRILSVAPAAEAKQPAGDSTEIDAAGRCVLPGLFDTHCGILRTIASERGDHLSQKNMAASVLRAVVNGRRALAAGVTTIRVDASPHHGIFALQEAFASGMLDGPRIVAPGLAITMTGGHAWYENREADGPDEVRKAAREQLKAGADWIKLMVTAGAGGQFANESPEQTQMAYEEVKAAVEEAHKKGRQAFAHVSCEEGARTAIGAGIDSIEHGLFLDDNIVKAMKDQGIFLVPTLWLYRRLVELGEKGEVPDWKHKRAASVVPRHLESFQRALRAGVKIAAGTDSGEVYTPIGESLLHEMETLHHAGMSAMEVILSATSRAAELLRMTADLGTIEPGKLADVLILGGDPLADIKAVYRTWMVFKEGRLVYRREEKPGAPRH